MSENFTEFSLRILRIIAELNHWQLHAHYATDTTIKKELAKEINPSNILFKKWKKKGLSPLTSDKFKKLVKIHTTGGKITYELTREGLNIAHEIYNS
jgi:hypothetical protein